MPLARCLSLAHVLRDAPSPAPAHCRLQPQLATWYRSARHRHCPLLPSPPAPLCPSPAGSWQLTWQRRRSSWGWKAESRCWSLLPAACSRATPACPTSSHLCSRCAGTTLLVGAAVCTGCCAGWSPPPAGLMRPCSTCLLGMCQVSVPLLPLAACADRYTCIVPRSFQIPFPGSLHITSARLCFVFEDQSIAPIKLPAKAIKPGGVTKLTADSDKGGQWQQGGSGTRHESCRELGSKCLSKA